MEGSIKVGDEIKFMANNKVHEVVEVGIYSPGEVKRKSLDAGAVGWFSAAIKTIKDVNVGDTVTTKANPTAEHLAGYRKLNPMVYAGFYPTDNQRYNDSS